HGRDPDVSPNDTWYTGHGMFVAGVAGAETNNGVGIASVGNKCKLMPLALSGTYANTMEAVIYAAQNGCKVVNMSWGRPWYASRWEQEMFNFLTEAYDVVFVAAAGNTPSYVDFFPATYDNVIAVAASNSADQRAWFSTYSHLIDIIAPGDMVYGTWNTGYNFGGSGTSYAAPFVAGAIGLIRSHFPHLNAKQAAELLRITADASFYSHPANSPFAEQLGYGRINVLRALTELGNSPVVRFHDWNYTSTNGKKIVPNVPIHIRMNFTNYFKATTNLTITLSTTSPYVTIANPTLYVGMLDYLQTIDNHTNPFQVTFSTSTPSNHKAIFRVGFSDGTYQDYQYFYITLDHHNWWNFSSPPFPSPYDLTINYFRVGLDADGRLGRTGTYSQPRGSGIYYKTSPNLVQEAGLIIATDATHVADGLRTTPGNQNDDFTVLDPALIYQYEGNFVSVHSRYEDYSRNTTPIHVEVTQLYTIWYPIEDASYFLIEYDILNKNTHSIPELYVGLFADWDISANDHADWHSTKKFGYVYNHAGNFYVGVLPLNDYVDYYAINVADGSEINNLDLTDGFSDA
ncbi:MAG: S8 family serine peptidase, partial [Flammeovirgaceae bacterium]|nr:S8 family serine peptidase [Flammeovirgaceae bacterium]